MQGVKFDTAESVSKTFQRLSCVTKTLFQDFCRAASTKDATPFLHNLHNVAKPPQERCRLAYKSSKHTSSVTSYKSSPTHFICTLNCAYYLFYPQNITSTSVFRNHSHSLSEKLSLIGRSLWLPVNETLLTTSSRAHALPPEK